MTILQEAGRGTNTALTGTVKVVRDQATASKLMASADPE